MDILIEILLELIFEGSLELLKNKKVPKWIRSIIALIFISFLVGMIVFGTILLRKSILGGFMIISVGLFLSIGVVIRVGKYIKN